MAAPSLAWHTTARSAAAHQCCRPLGRAAGCPGHRSAAGTCSIPCTGRSAILTSGSARGWGARGPSRRAVPSGHTAGSGQQQRSTGLSTQSVCFRRERDPGCRDPSPEGPRSSGCCQLQLALRHCWPKQLVIQKKITVSAGPFVKTWHVRSTRKVT